MYACMYNTYIHTTNYFIHLPISGHLDCFYAFAIVNNAARNMVVQISFWLSIFISFGYSLRSGVAELYGSSILIFWEASILFFTMAVPIYSPTTIPKIPFALHPRQHLLSHLFDYGHSTRLEGISHCLIDISLMMSDVEYIFMYLFIKELLWGKKKSVQVLCPSYFSVMECMSSSYIFNINPLSDMWFTNILPSPLAVILLMVSFAM